MSEIRDQIFDRAHGGVSFAAPKAVRTLYRQLSSESEATRLRAARSILSLVLPLRKSVERNLRRELPEDDSTISASEFWDTIANPEKLRAFAESLGDKQQNVSEEVTHADDLLASALARGQTVRAAAKSAGMRERTANRRWQDAEFRHRVKERRRSSLR